METGVQVSIRNLSKYYGSSSAVDDVSIDIKAGEFFSLLGPSGSGKSTILMSIAGFETPSSGTIAFNGTPVNDLPAHRRNIGMVFQRYALFPHMTVAENIAYPLRRRGRGREEIQREVKRALALVRLDAIGERYPSQLSGGQQQRVALARALVFRPSVLLMDESLSALDRKLRQQMQLEIKLLHREIGTTIIFVTHDQEEALSMSNRVAVLQQGKLQQIGTSAQLYETPANAFVADFVGETNFLPAEIVRTTSGSRTVRVVQSSVTLDIAARNCVTDDRHALVGIRPDAMRVTEPTGGLTASVVETAYAGASVSVLLAIGELRLIARMPAQDYSGRWLPGTEVGVALDEERCRLYSVDASVCSLAPREREYSGQSRAGSVAR